MEELDISLAHRSIPDGRGLLVQLSDDYSQFQRMSISSPTEESQIRALDQMTAEIPDNVVSFTNGTITYTLPLGQVLTVRGDTPAWTRVHEIYTAADKPLEEGYNFLKACTIIRD